MIASPRRGTTSAVTRSTFVRRGVWKTSASSGASAKIAEYIASPTKGEKTNTEAAAFRRSRLCTISAAPRPDSCARCATASSVSVRETSPKSEGTSRRARTIVVTSESTFVLP